jgi:hypothetical protein
LLDGEVEFEVELVFEVGTDVVVEDELVTVVEVAFEFAAVLAGLFVVLLAVSPPQAAPRAAKPKSAESAIAFFMLKTISCLYSKINLRSTARGRVAPKLFLFLEQTK